MNKLYYEVALIQRNFDVIKRFETVIFNLFQRQSQILNLNFVMSSMQTGAAAPGFNSLIAAPSVPSLISTEPI